MKKNTLSTLVATTLLVLPVLANAETPKPINARIEDRIEVRQNKIEDLKAKASSTREKIEDKIDDRRENLRRIAQNKLEKMVRRFESTIQREENIMNRIISRIEKVKSNGGNTADSEKYITTSTIIKNGLKKLKDMAQNVQKHIRLGHKSLENAVKSLRGASSTRNATTTNSN